MAAAATNNRPTIPVDIQDIRRIVELMNEHGLTLFDLTKKDFHLKLKKGTDIDDLRVLLASLPAAAGVLPPPAMPPPVAPAVEAAVAAPAEKGSEIISPMVGTFYLKVSPGGPNFVDVGSTVSIGQVVCIIEAMKVMNEIKAEQGGTVTAIVAEDGTPVQYGDVLFLLK